MKMISTQRFYEELEENDIHFFTGVPDSLLKDFCAYLSGITDQQKHIVAANEGGAVALASGYHLATGKIGLVYMQNSGLGNAVNPLVSLAHSAVYKIPMVLLIGWRGEPGEKDEPQHQAQGEITLPLLDLLDIPYEVLPKEEVEISKTIKKVCKRVNDDNTPVAIIVKRGTFVNKPVDSQFGSGHGLTRENALRTIIPRLDDAIVVSTTGKLSRELLEIRESLEDGNKRDFLTVGSMGHASQIALGIAIAKLEKKVFCLDGDGASIMHLGCWAVIGEEKPANFHHIVFNNGVHESVGGQSTAGPSLDFKRIAEACGYPTAFCVETEEELDEAITKIKKSKDLTFLEIKIENGSRPKLKRPSNTPVENKHNFMKNFL